MSEFTTFQVSGSAPEAYERHIAGVMAPLVASLIESAGLRPGESVLDIATGTGFVARAAAPLVGTVGRVTAADLNPDMIAMAQAACADVRPAIEFTVAPADALPFPDASFDAVLCQQGMQFFPDLDAAVAEAVRVLRPGGRLAATVWAPMHESPWMAAQGQAFTAVLGEDVGATFQAPFSLTDERLTEAFARAGLREIGVERLRPLVTLPPIAEFLPGNLRSIPWGAALADVPGGEQRMLELMSAALAEHVAPDGSLTLPFSSLLVHARR
jgi:SAM-dependent methyltransferase